MAGKRNGKGKRRSDHGRAERSTQPRLRALKGGAAYRDLLLPDDDLEDYVAAFAPLGVTRKGAEVAWLLRSGFGNRTMALALGVSASAIKQRLERLMAAIERGLPGGAIFGRTMAQGIVARIVRAYRRWRTEGGWIDRVAQSLRAQATSGDNPGGPEATQSSV